MMYIDATVFISSFLEEGEETKLSKSVLEKITTNEINAFTSALTWDEIVWAARKHLSPQDGIEQGKKFLEFPYLNFIEADEIVIKTAQDIMERYGLKPRDAIHAASAISKGIKEIISEDEDFDTVKELKRRGLRDFK
ncbi:MAG: type II toxin-antitoxin system VapC family toxin [Candidatus Aenigmarchaeota archaeon]|nr:type II toxin-antitoxin system VapC family toxin [Candidatus Aenigmarchaeota archaeon]